MFTLLLWSAPTAALTWYSPGSTRFPPSPQPVLRFQETRRVAFVLLARTTGSEPEPLAQSAELQIGRPAGVSITTDTSRGLMSKWQGWLSVEMACTVKCGVLPDWYQYCGDVTVSVTPPGVQAGVSPETWAGRLFLWCAGAWLGWVEGEAAGDASAALGRVGVCRAVWCRDARLWPAAVARPVGDPVENRLVTVQLRVVSKPIPMPRTTTRRRQYVALETLGRGTGAPRLAGVPVRCGAPLRTGAPWGRSVLGGELWVTLPSM